jgi:hypothetical protein
MARAPTDIRSLARSHTNLAIKVLAGIAKDGLNEGARVSAAVALLDRGWGKPAQMHTGEDGGDIRITIRKIFDDRDEEKPLLLEHSRSRSYAHKEP